MDDVEFVHKVNVIGPLRVSQAMLPLLKKGNKKVVSIHTLARLVSPHVTLRLQIMLADTLASASCLRMGPGVCAVIFLLFCWQCWMKVQHQNRSARQAGLRKITAQPICIFWAVNVANPLYHGQCAAVRARAAELPGRA